MASACLAGVFCRYDGTARPWGDFPELFARGELTPFCPEVLGGLPTPRPRMTLAGGDGAAVLDGNAKAVAEDGRDVTAEMLEGARLSAAMARAIRPEKIVLKSKSPSCGLAGVTAAALLRAGFNLEEAG